MISLYTGLEGDDVFCRTTFYLSFTIVSRASGIGNCQLGASRRMSAQEKCAMEKHIFIHSTVDIRHKMKTFPHGESKPMSVRDADPNN